MVWTKKDGKGRTCFIRKDGDNVTLTTEKRGNLLEDVPGGWEVKPEGKRLRLRRA